MKINTVLLPLTIFEKISYNFERAINFSQPKIVDLYDNVISKWNKQTNKKKNVNRSTVMQIEKALINDRLRVSKISLKFCTPPIYKFAVIYP